MDNEKVEKKVGRYENVSFPELTNVKLKGKIDTGAYGIALHVDDIEVVDGKLKFRINSEEFVYDKFKKVSVRSSFGRKQERFLVFTKIKIGESTYKFFISLANRKNMRYPVLIGRRFLHKFNYIVDVRMKNINDTDKKK
jgi:hypothetical protein